MNLTEGQVHFIFVLLETIQKIEIWKENTLFRRLKFCSYSRKDCFVPAMKCLERMMANGNPESSAIFLEQFKLN